MRRSDYCPRYGGPADGASRAGDYAFDSYPYDDP